MNRRVLAALLTLADTHEAKESHLGNLDVAYGKHGTALACLSDDDHELYTALAKALCANGETVTFDPDGTSVLELARAGTLPTTSADLAKQLENGR